MNNRILLLEDEQNVGSTLQERLQHAGFSVTWAQSLKESHLALQQENFHLALLDINVPDGSGFELGAVIRKKHPATALVFLTAAGTPEDRIQGLELGAEDYIVKPFHFKELQLRIQNALKRAVYIADSTTAEQVTLGKAKVSFDQYELTLEGESPIHLSHKECALLKLLYQKRGLVVSRDEILNLIWSEDEYPTPRTVDNFILRLRKWIEPNSDSPTVIRSVRGVGYLLEKD